MIYLRRVVEGRLWVNVAQGLYTVRDDRGAIHTGYFFSADAAERARANEQARWDACRVLGK